MFFQSTGKKYSNLKLICHLCRNMSTVPEPTDDFYELANSLEASTGVEDVEMDEAILDAEDEDEEIQILDPPPLPHRRIQLPNRASPHRLKKKR